MKIALPISDNKENSDICPSFGRASYFLIINTQTNETTRFENVAASGAGGAGIAAAQSIIDRGADVVITERCGENAAKVLARANIKLLKSASKSIQENVEAFSAGQLSELGDIHPGLHHHGG